MTNNLIHIEMDPDELIGVIKKDEYYNGEFENSANMTLQEKETILQLFCLAHFPDAIYIPLAERTPSDKKHKM